MIHKWIWTYLIAFNSIKDRDNTFANIEVEKIIKIMILINIYSIF
jgi:hypothetical protein